jgi:hypothetical protein
VPFPHRIKVLQQIGRPEHSDQRNDIGNPIPPFLLSNWLSFSMICRKETAGWSELHTLQAGEVEETTLTLRQTSLSVGLTQSGSREPPDDPPIPNRIGSGWNPTIALSSGEPYIRHMISST